MPGSRKRHSKSGAHPGKRGTQPHSPAPVQRRPDRRTLLGAIAVFAAGFIVFANSLGNGFVYDDLQIIRDNSRLDSPWDFRVFFGTPYWASNLQGTALYRPLTLWSFAVDRALFGPGPFGVHLVNVLGNSLAGVLVFVLGLRLALRFEAALIAGLLFVIHPIHTEAVANGVGRAEIHCAICVLLGALSHLRHLRDWSAAASLHGPPAAQARRRAWTWIVVALVFYWLGLLFKETAATLPGLLFLIEWTVLNDGDLRKTLRGVWRYLLYAAPLALYLALRTGAIGGGVPSPQEVVAGASPAVRMLHASGVMLRYVGQLLFPVWMCAEYSDYDNPVRQAVSDPLALVSVAVWIGLAAFTWWLARRRQWVPVAGIAWFFLSILPTSNLLFPIGTVRADRLLYLPSVGFCVAVGYALSAAGVPRRKVLLGVVALWMVLLAGRTVVRNSDWKSTETLWPVTVRDNPGSPVGWSFVGDIHRDRGETTKALELYEHAVALRGKMGVTYAEAANNAAQMLVRLGRAREAETMYRHTLEKVPGNFVALLNLGELLIRDPGRLDEAESLLNRAHRADDKDFRVYGNLSQVMMLRKQPQVALELIDRAIALKPGDPLAWEARARVLDALGRPAEARQARAKRDVLRARGR